MKSRAHIKEILLYLLAWLVIPLLLVALVEFGCSYFGAESEMTSKVLLLIRCGIYLHLFLHPIPKEYDKQGRYGTIGIRDLMPGLPSRKHKGEEETDETEDNEETSCDTEV